MKKKVDEQIKSIFSTLEKMKETTDSLMKKYWPDEMSVVRENLLNRVGYMPYCGGQCSEMPRTQFNGQQFECPSCGWESQFENEFIAEYKKVNHL